MGDGPDSDPSVNRSDHNRRTQVLLLWSDCLKTIIPGLDRPMDIASLPLMGLKVHICHLLRLWTSASPENPTSYFSTSECLLCLSGRLTLSWSLFDHYVVQSHSKQWSNEENSLILPPSDHWSSNTSDGTKTFLCSITSLIVTVQPIIERILPPSDHWSSITSDGTKTFLVQSLVFAVPSLVWPVRSLVVQYQWWDYNMVLVRSLVLVVSSLVFIVRSLVGTVWLLLIVVRSLKLHQFLTFNLPTLKTRDNIGHRINS